MHNISLKIKQSKTHSKHNGHDNLKLSFAIPSLTTKLVVAGF